MSAENANLRDEVANLRLQLEMERAAHIKEMARMRAQLRGLEGKLANTTVLMDNLLATVEARERTVQELLSASFEDTVLLPGEETKGEPSLVPISKARSQSYC